MQTSQEKFKNLTEKLFSKKIIFIAIAVILIIIGGFFIGKKTFKPEPKRIYEIAVMARSQSNPNLEEDSKSSLKAGDVLVVQKDGHNWSTTEKASYLILKMNLTKKQAAKLIMPDEKEIKFKDLSEEKQERVKEDKKRVKDADEEYMEKQRMEIITARKYCIDMGEFEGFEANDLLNGQPFLDEVFDWGIVNKK